MNKRFVLHTQICNHTIRNKKIEIQQFEYHIVDFSTLFIYLLHEYFRWLKNLFENQIVSFLLEMLIFHREFLGMTPVID